MGYLIILPLMVASLAEGYLYKLIPVPPWMVATAAGPPALLLSIFFICDPERAEV